MDIEARWSQTNTELSRSPSHLPLVVLGDLNSRLGSHVSHVVGSLDAEEENVPGHARRAFMMEHALMAPATFQDIRQGPSYTWISASGQKHRLDYVLIPLSRKTCGVKSHENYEVDLAAAKHDHFMVQVSVDFHVASSHVKSDRPNIDVRKCKDPSLAQQF